MSLFERLARLVAVPVDPIDAVGDWLAVEAQLPVTLPTDYKELVERYGWGEFCDFLYVRTPFGGNRHNGLSWQDVRYQNEWTVPGSKRLPYPLYPAPGALLIWGGSPDADRLCWLTEGPPDTWPVVVWSRDDDYEVYEMGCAAFIEGWTSGKIRSGIIGGMELGLRPWFTTARELQHVNIRLSDGTGAYLERLRILRDSLGPTEDRGTYQSPYEDDVRQDHFAVSGLDWRLTYETAYGHQIRAAFPAEDGAAARLRIWAAVELMGCRVLSARTNEGVPMWEDAFSPDTQDISGDK
ncbi:SMI1/KNR4 family protein [Streptomyces rhizosphaerihabitans]|uniref:SMI1/KNR4 family protein n=1 Tax=Streptomyces rhizosphaerihabitans TaxID=1266770 RepID=UPI0021C03789|nr:SMI1/KNR4 family protein [Streptomyces rhizosphaerihabitans]MCT9010269.1 SMI1/KNR4 family protein [Streptomyces rhizosphaerihabitans]